jgi:hypothetical protein
MESHNQIAKRLIKEDNLRKENAMTRFRLGRIVITRHMNDQIAGSNLFAKFVWDSLKRHVCNDWGDLDDHDKAVNDQALIPGQEGRLFSAYKMNGHAGLIDPEFSFADGNDKIWIITERDRSSTTILFPSEY